MPCGETRSIGCASICKTAWKSAAGSSAGEPLGSRGDPLVRGGQRHPHVPGPGRARRTCRARPGCRARRGRRRSASSPRRGWPRGRASPRSGRPGSRPPRSAAPQRRPTRGVAGALLDGVGVVAQGRGHRDLLRARAGSARGSCGRRAARPRPRGRRRRSRAVAGEVGALGQRVDGEDAVVATAGDVGVEHRDRRFTLPAALEVALVADQQRAALAAPRDDLAQVLGAAAPGRSGWPGS